MRARFIPAPEAIEHVGQFLGRNAFTRVTHADFNSARGRNCRDRDGAVGGRVAQRIADQHAQHLRHAFGIRFHQRQIVGNMVYNMVYIGGEP